MFYKFTLNYGRIILKTYFIALKDDPSIICLFKYLNKRCVDDSMFSNNIAFTYMALFIVVGNVSPVLRAEQSREDTNTFQFEPPNKQQISLTADGLLFNDEEEEEEK